jgi:multisubunit Na+/H+ antiporter MnhC subunit
VQHFDFKAASLTRRFGSVVEHETQITNLKHFILMLTGIIGIALLALFLVPVLILNTRKGKKNDQETEENK